MLLSTFHKVITFLHLVQFVHLFGLSLAERLVLRLLGPVESLQQKLVVQVGQLPHHCLAKFCHDYPLSQIRLMI